MRKPTYGTFFEAIHKDYPNETVRVIVPGSGGGVYQYIRMNPHCLEVELRGSGLFKPLARNSVMEANAHLYTTMTGLIETRLKRLYNTAKTTGLCYPVYCDPDDHLWYVTPHSTFKAGQNWGITLLCPSLKRQIIVERSHGPFDWNFCHNGELINPIEKSHWIALDGV